jgi:hypothetical protein
LVVNRAVPIEIVALPSSSNIADMVRLVVTPEIQDAIAECNTRKGLSASSDDDYIKQDSQSIEHMQLAYIASNLKLPLNKLLNGTKIYIPPIENPKPVCSPLKVAYLC